MSAIAFAELRPLFPTAGSMRDMRAPVRQLRARRAARRQGLGYEYTPGSTYDMQSQLVESRPQWGYQLPAQSMAVTKAGAPALRYAFPATESAFLERQARLVPGQGTYAGEIQSGIPAALVPLLAKLNPQLQLQFAQPWKNPWTAEQFWGGSPQGIPIWGGNVAQGWSVPQGVGPARMATPTSGGWPDPGSAIERF